MIGILCLIDLSYIPYLKKYTQFLQEKNVDFEVIYWKRLPLNEEYDFKTVIFEREADLSRKKHQKVMDFFYFRRFVIHTLKKKKYEKLIVLSTLMGVLIADYLTTRYKDNYLFDIRDYTYEWFAPFYRIEKNVIEHSNYVVISSKGFTEFLPKGYSYILCHNFLKEEVDENRRFEKKTTIPLEIAFIGAVRHFDLDKRIVDELSGDERFKIVYHGYGASYNALKNYCKDKPVLLTGKYDRNDKAKLLATADIINSYYGVNKVNQYAVSNKYYDAVLYRKPLWVNPQLYIGRLALEKGIGLVCDLNKEDIYEAYSKMKEEDFERNCQAVIKEIFKDELVFYNRLGKFIR